MSEESYDKLSKWYDFISGSGEKKIKNEGLNILAPKEGEQILEIGFGTGNAIISMAKSVGKSGRIFGIDISQGMLDIAKVKVDKAGLLDRVVLKREDATIMNFDSDYFDAVFMSFTLELFSKPQMIIILEECKKILKKNGRICILSMLKTNKKPSIISRLYAWAQKQFPEYVDCRPINLQQVLKNEGFVISESKQMSVWGLPVEIGLATIPR